MFYILAQIIFFSSHIPRLCLVSSFQIGYWILSLFSSISFNEHLYSSFTNCYHLNIFSDSPPSTAWGINCFLVQFWQLVCRHAVYVQQLHASTWDFEDWGTDANLQWNGEINHCVIFESLVKVLLYDRILARIFLGHWLDSSSAHILTWFSTLITDL